MRTGLKTASRNAIDRVINAGVSPDIFPDQSIGRMKLNARLLSVKRNLAPSNHEYNLGALSTHPDPYVSKVYGSFLGDNVNHLGTWCKTPTTYTTQRLEYEVIQKMAYLYHAKKGETEGYITSGGTEGNLFSVWTGRSYLAQFTKVENMAMLLSNLTHYSIYKAANICNISTHTVALDSVSWGISASGLNTSVKRLYKKGIRGFLLPLTLGYTSTGSSDDIASLIQAVEALEKKYTDIRFYIWIDAALNGLIEPFIQPSFAPFASGRIQSIVVDFHKFGLVPYSAGIVLYRTALRKYIEKPIDYLDALDVTISGSRSGAPAAAIWSAIHMFGKKGYQNMVELQKKNKQYFLSELQKHFPNAEVITHEHSLSCGVIFRSLKRNALPSSIESKYWLYPAKTAIQFYPNSTKRERIYKFFYLPHMRKKIIAEFFSDVTHAT